MVAGVVIYSLVSIVILWSGVMDLLRSDSPLPALLPGKGLRDAIRILIAAPLAITAVVALLVPVLLGAQVSSAARLGHATLLLGWWLAAVLLLFALFAYRRLARSLPVSTVVGLLLCLAPIIYLTPLSNFVTVFEPLGYDRAVIIGLALIAMTASALRRLARLSARA
ncbi:MAG: hypothetical protein ACYC5O_04220 [Anaerolineae bacterium]